MSSDASNPLIQRVLSGEDPGLARLAAQGVLPVPPDELVALQVALASGAGAVDPEVAGVARTTLAELPPDRVAGIIAEGPAPEVLRHFALTRSEPTVLEAVLRTRDVAAELLAEVATHLPAKLQEQLLVRQDVIVRHPEILDALERNPELSSYSRRRIGEFREHLLPTEAPEGEEDGEEDEPTDAEVAEAIEEARERELPSDQGGRTEEEQSTGLTGAQIRTLPVPVRRKLARTTASKSLRESLMRDPNPQVALAALSGANMTEGDVEKLAANRSVASELLEEIARRRDWVNKYKVVAALVHNPRTPAGVAVRLLPRVSVRELGMLARDHNVSSAVRTNAQRLYRMKRR